MRTHAAGFDLVEFADGHRSDVVLPAVLSEGHTYTTREPVLKNAVDVDRRGLPDPDSAQTCSAAPTSTGSELRFTEEKVP